jgi:hypothetical protein
MNEQQVLDKPISTSDLARGMGENTAKVAVPAQNETALPLFAKDEADDFRSRWQEVQTAFVDEPRQAVQKADELVAAAMKRLAEVFSSERDKLEHEWDRNEDVSTEDLRLALRRYRSFFDRLLSV